MSKSKKKRDREEREEREERYRRKIRKLEEALKEKQTRDNQPPLSIDNNSQASSDSNDSQNDENPSLPTDSNSQVSDLPTEGLLEPINKEKTVCDSKTSETETPVLSDDTKVKDQLDPEIIEILGDDPLAEDPQVGTLHSELATRWSNYISEGLKKDLKTELLSKYPRASNCQLEAQILNPEIAASMQDAALKRDKYASEIQKIIGSAMLALGMGISLMLDEKEDGVDRKQLLQYLSDAGRLIAEAHHREAVKRRSFILPGMEKNIMEVLEKCKIDKFLFGEGLSEKIKSTKSIEKVAAEIKSKPNPKKLPVKPSQSVNWKTPSSKVQWSRVGNSKSTLQGKSSGSSAPRKPYQSPQHQSKSARPGTDRRH